jgi:hypothetical protein
LEKQSQFQNRQNGVKSVTVKNYGDFCVFGQFMSRENKPKRSQFQVSAPNEEVGNRQQSLTAANSSGG